MRGDLTLSAASSRGEAEGQALTCALGQVTSDRTRESARSCGRAALGWVLRKGSSPRGRSSRHWKRPPQKSSHGTELDKSSRSLDRADRRMVGIPGVVLCRARRWTPRSLWVPSSLGGSKILPSDFPAQIPQCSSFTEGAEVETQLLL